MNLTPFIVVWGLAATMPPQAPPTITEYVIPRAGSFPHDPAVAADGSIWYTDQRNSFIGHLDPKTGKIVDYPTPTPGSGPHGITVAPDGGVWYTGQAKGLLGRVDPGSGKILEFPLPGEIRNPHTPIFHRGKVWFTDANNNSYGSLDPSTGKATAYRVPTAGSQPYGMVAAPDGSIWIAMLEPNKLGHVDPATGSIREFVLPAAEARPRRLQVGGDGTVWYTDYARGYLGALDPATGKVRVGVALSERRTIRNRDRDRRPHLVLRIEWRKDGCVRSANRENGGRPDSHARRNRPAHGNRQHPAAGVACPQRYGETRNDRPGQEQGERLRPTSPSAGSPSGTSPTRARRC